MEQIFYLPSTMIWPLVACVLLTGVLVLLGVHVIARKVIFVDLDLAQMAALGTVVGVLLGYEAGKDSTALYLYSLAFTIFGAFIFSVTRMRGEKIPHEAIIGIIYAVTFAATILVLSRSALGPQELDHIIKGELLWVQSPVVIKTAIIYLLAGIFHFTFRKNFMAISLDAMKAEEDGINVRLWDFLFYMMFGFVITSSVAIAGVFLVFSYLVIPAVGAMLLTDKLVHRLLVGWIGGSVISFIGVKLSWTTGLPTSPLIVCLLALALIISGIIRYIRSASSKFVAVRNLALYLLAAGVFFAGVFALRKPQEDQLEHTLHMLNGTLSTDRQTAIANLANYTDQKDRWLQMVVSRLADDDAEVRRAAVDLLVNLEDHQHLPDMLKLLNDKSDQVRKSLVNALKKLGDPRDGEELVRVAKSEDDPEFQVAFLSTAVELGTANAVLPLAELAGEKSIFSDDAYHELRAHVQIEFTKDEIPKLVNWWKTNSSRIIWDKSAKTFMIQTRQEKHG